MVKKRMMSHTINKIYDKSDIDRNKIKMISVKWLTEINVLYKVDIIKCIINWMVAEIYSKGIIMKIFKNDNNNSKSEIEIKEDDFNIKEKNKKINFDNIFSNFELFRKNELEIDRKWTLLYKNIIINFILYGFVVIKYKDLNDVGDNKKIPEILDPIFDCSVGFSDNVDELLKFYVFSQSNSNSTKTDKMTSELIEDVRVIEYSTLNKNLKIFESNINQIKNTTYLYTAFLINNAKYNYFATNPPRVYNPKDDDKLKVSSIQTVTEDLGYHNIIQGGRLLSDLNKIKKENNIKEIQDLQEQLIQTNIILNKNDGNRFIKKKIKDCNDTKKLKEIDLLEPDNTLPISYETIVPKNLEVDPNNEIKIQSQHEYIKTINNFIELICLGLNLRADIIFPSISSKVYTAGQEFISSGFNRTISNWQEEISNTIFIIYADIMLPYLYQLFKKTLKEKKKNEIINNNNNNNNIDQKIEDMLSPLIVNITFKPNQKLNLNSLLIFEKMRDNNLIPDEFYVNLALNVYSLGELEPDQIKSKKIIKRQNIVNDDNNDDNDDQNNNDDDDNNKNSNNNNKNKRKNKDKIENNKTKKQKTNKKKKNNKKKNNN